MKTNCALITGAGDGLGRSFALQCASRGYNLFLISLPGSQLARIAYQIEFHYQVQVFTIELDLCNPDSINRVMDFIENNNLGIHFLINNAGLGHHKSFEELTSEYIRKQITLNVTVPTLLIHSLLPLLKQQDSAYILNVGSMASDFIAPNKNTYSASKSYLKQLSLSLRTELDGSRVHLSVMCPSGITTNAQQYTFHRSANWLTKISVMHPDVVAEYAIYKCLKGSSVIIPGSINRIMWHITLMIPSGVKRFLAKKALQERLRIESSTPVKAV